MNYTKIILPYRLKNSVLALGGQSKSAFCLAEGNTAYLSEPGGDLSDLDNFRSFEKEIKMARKRFSIKPRIIACDLHPEYISTKYASELGGVVKKIQHHEAHAASCIADNNIKGDVIGVAFDGTGFGSDGNIWGGEFFVGGARGFRRTGHLKYTRMPGGEACVREPWRMALSYLYDINSNGIERLKIDTEMIDIVIQMMDKDINSPLASSMGRLFDAVSALCGVRRFAKYEGEAAIKLEKLLATLFRQGYGGQARRQGGKAASYKFNIIRDKGIFIIEPNKVIKGIVSDLNKEIQPSVISLKFHDAICGMIREVCVLLRKRYKINTVCMSGGVFQNKYLSSRLAPILASERFRAYLHKNVPTHDGGIPLGQALLSA